MMSSSSTSIEGPAEGPVAVERSPSQPQAMSGIRLAQFAWSLGFFAAPAMATFQGALAVLIGLSPLAIAWLTRLIVDMLVAGADHSALMFLVGALGLTTFAAANIPPVQRFVSAEFKRKVHWVAQERLYRAIERCRGLARLEQPAFHNRLKLAQISGDEAPAELAEGIVVIIQGVITAIGFIAILLAIDWVLGAIVVAAMIPSFVMERSLARQRAQQEFRLTHGVRRKLFYQDILSSLRSAKEVRLFGLAGFFRRRMLDELTRIDADKRELESRQARVQVSLASISAGVSVLGLIWAVRSATAGALSAGDIVMVLAAVAGVQMAIQNTVSQGGRLHQALLLFENYVTVTSITDDDLPQAKNPVPVPCLNHAIRFEDVWFRYADDLPWVLQGVHLELPAGSSLGLVGKNGSGKSTLVKLLCRFYDPTRGRILWDGVDIRSFDIQAYRDHLSGVFQDYMEYEFTARENVELGDIHRQPDPAAVKRAAVQAGINQVIQNLPSGYETLLSIAFFDAVNPEGGEGEVNPGTILSGGQWQRLALARAYYREHRDLLILDEPNAGMDAEAEYELHRGLLEHRQNKTSMLVSHRMSALRDADMIATLAEGKVVELGTHAELMAFGGLYARLFNLQARGYIEDPTEEREWAP